MTSISSTAYSDGIEVADFASAGLDSSERIGRAMERPRSRIVRRGLLAIGLLGAGAATYADPGLWQRGWTTARPLVGALVEAVRTPPTATAVAPPAEATQRAIADPPIEKRAALPVEKPRPPASEPPAAPTPTVTPTVQPPPPSSPAKPAQKAALADGSRPAGDAYAAPTPTAADPLTKRAEAVGLHPDLSRALLQRLSDGDFKTAATAINKALSEVGDTETFVWPQKAAKGATRFRISFVQGAPQDCRRYVVEIAKDGWQTTALPVEKCGVKRRLTARG